MESTYHIFRFCQTGLLRAGSLVDGKASVLLRAFRVRSLEDRRRIQGWKATGKVRVLRFPLKPERDRWSGDPGMIDCGVEGFQPHERNCMLLHSDLFRLHAFGREEAASPSSTVGMCRSRTDL